MRTLFLILFLASGLCLQGCATNGVASHANWENGQGGLVSNGHQDLAIRAQKALSRVQPGCKTLPLRISVLNNPLPVAHSFRDGSLYVSTGLLQRLSDDELAAAVAHELGHLVIDGIVSPQPAALAGVPIPTANVELHADLLARNILHSQGMPPAALTTALEKVAAASTRQSCYQPLLQRIATLQKLDHQNSDN